MFYRLNVIPLFIFLSYPFTKERLAELAIGSDPSKFIRSLMRELFTEQDLARITFSEMEQGHQTLIFSNINIR